METTAPVTAGATQTTTANESEQVENTENSSREADNDGVKRIPWGQGKYNVLRPNASKAVEKVKAIEKAAQHSDAPAKEVKADVRGTPGEAIKKEASKVEAPEAEPEFEELTVGSKKFKTQKGLAEHFILKVVLKEAL